MVDTNASAIVTIGRVTAAILATTVGASALGSVAIFAFIAYTAHEPLRAVHMIWTGIFLWGLIYAVIPALVLGLLFEQAIGRVIDARSGLLVHVIASAVIGAFLLGALAWFADPPDRFEAALFLAFFGALGGVSSALAWRRFVFRHS